jgi:hypothetical protein
MSRKDQQQVSIPCKEGTMQINHEGLGVPKDEFPQYTTESDEIATS